MMIDEFIPLVLFYVRNRVDDALQFELIYIVADKDTKQKDYF